MAIANNISGAPRGNEMIKAVPVLLLIVGLIGFLYTQAIRWWYQEWTMDGSYYAHGIFIPFFVAAMIWKDRDKLRALPIQRSWLGLIPMVPAILLVIYAYRADVTVPLSISFILFLFGSMLTIAGAKVTKRLIFPIMFMFTMIPIVPNGFINQIAFPIQVLSAKLSEIMLNIVGMLMGFHAVRTGTQIQMDSYLMNVEVPCSGFKTLIGLLSFAGAFAYLIESALWKRWALFIITIPLSVLINGLRITLIGLVGELFSGKAAATFHDYSGFIVLILGFMFLFSLAKWLKCESFLGIPIMDPPAKPTSGSEETTESAPEVKTKKPFKWPQVNPATISKLTQGAYPVVVLLMISCAIKVSAKPVPAIYPVLKEDQVPRSFELGKFVQMGKDIPITEDVKATLMPEVYVSRLYQGVEPETGMFDLFITGGSSRRTFHDPHECFLGSGYTLRDISVETIQTASGPVSVQKSVAHEIKTGKQSLLMFVFVIDGKLMYTMANVHKALLMQTFFGSKGYPFYFVRFRQNQDGIGLDREVEMKKFIAAVWPSIAPKILGSAPGTQSARR